ncbi:MAG TPA: hypothetical protein VMU04_10160 [Candidatus Acidoferrum sp.]|nr:hypothetical protein [Candidatus Acidoferrum sp.]
MKPSIQNTLENLRYKVTALNSLTAHRGSLRGLDKTFEAALNQTDEQRQKLGKLLERARRGQVEAATELNALRTTTIDLYVRAMSNFIAFFRPVNLEPNEQACFVHTFRNPVAVRYMGQDGGVKSVKAVKAQRPIFIDMREITSDAVGYQIRDLNLGPDVAAAAQATVDIGWDMANKVDFEAYTMMTSGESTLGTGYEGYSIYGPFNLTGTELSRTWIPNDRILPSNLPTTNDLVLSDNGSGEGQSNQFRLAVFRAILKYCEAWGNIWGTPIRPTGMILVSSADVTDLASEITPTSLIFPNAVAEGILQNYSQVDYMNVRWTLVPDVTLPSGVCYPVLNRPVGEVYYKPAFDEEFVETDRKRNWEERSSLKVLNFAIPEPWRVNALRVTYADLDELKAQAKAKLASAKAAAKAKGRK